MGQDYKKKALAKAKQNRVNKVNNTNKYFKTETSKSQKDFIAGDVVSSASKKAWAYKEYGMPEQSAITGGRSKANYKATQEGKTPYKATYLYDGKKRTATNSKGEKFTSRKRFLTDDEKDSLKATGDTNVTNYKKNYKYSILKGADSDGKTYGSNFNLRNKDGSMKWDGMNVAKNKVKNGGSKLNYVGGFLKDTVVDAGVDTLKTFDRYESGAMGGALGFAENVKNGVDSITNGDFKFKNVDMGRIKKNWNASIEESNKTGWGLGAGDYLKQMSNREDDKMYKYLLNKKGQKSADKYRSNEQKMQGVENVTNGVIGLGLDILNPIEIGGAVVKGLKGATKGTFKAGKELFNGTADISTAFKIDPLKTQSMVDKYANRITKSTKGDETLNTLTGQGNINHNKRGSMLDQEYERAMSKTDDLKQVIKSNPSTQKLGSFLDEIGDSVDSGTQRSIDGRTLNKKYTQTKDAYLPQTIRGEENVDNIVNNNKSNQLTFNSSNRLNNKYEKLSKTPSNENDLFNTIDNLDDRSSDEFLDWLKSNNPSTYNKYMGNADQLDEFANQGIQTQRLAEKSDNTIVNNFNKNAKTISEKPKYNYEKVNHIIDENAKVSSTTTPKKFKNSHERKYEFENSIRNLSKDMYEGKVDADDISQTIQKVKGEDVPVKIKREYVNNKLFGGNEVIANNVSGSSIDGLLDSVEDITNLKKVVSHYQQTGEVLPVKLSDATKDFLKVDDNLKVVGSKVRGNKMHDPEELVETLNKSIVDRAKALTDERYGDKLQLMASEFKYDKYSDVTTALDKLKATRKELDKTQGVSIDEKMELSANIKRLTELITQREDMWQRIRNLPEDAFDKFVDEKYSHHKGSLRSYQSKTDQSKLMEFLSKGDGIEDVKNMELDKSFEQGFGSNRSTFNDVAPEVKGDALEVAINKTAKEKNLDNAGLKKANEFKKNIKESERLTKYHNELGEFAKKIGVSIPKKTQVSVKLAKNQKLGSLPPVQENLNNLKSLIKKEVEEMYTNPTLYNNNQRLYSSLKKEYINGLRSYGIPDNAYFEKATNLKKSLMNDLKKQGFELPKKDVKVEKPIDLVREAERDKLLKSTKYKELSDTEIFERKKNKSSEGSVGTPKFGMNLQLLAKKVDDMFNEFSGKSIDELESSSKALNTTENVSKGSLDKIVDNATGSAKNPFDEVAMDVDEQPKGKVNSFLKSVEDKFKDSNLSENSLEKVLESKKKKYLSQKGISDANNPLYKDFKLKDGQLPSKSAKRLENGNVVDLDSGQVKYAKQNKGELKDIIEDNKYHYKNKEEDKLIENLLSNPNAKPEHFMAIFDKMNIPYDITDDKSLQKAFERFDWIVNKKSEEGTLNIVKPKQVKSSNKITNPNVIENKQMRKSMRKQQYSKTTNNDFETAQTKKSDLEKILNYEKNKAPNQELIDKIQKPTSLLDEIKSNKTKESKVIDDKLNDELAIDSIGKTLDKDIKRFEESLSKENPPTFEKFKKFFGEKSENTKVGYEDSPLYKIYKPWLNSWKKGLTVYNPGWHVQNFFQNKGQNYLALGPDAFGSQKNARNVLSQINGVDKGEYKLTSKGGKTYTKGELAKLSKDYNVAEGMATHEVKSNGVFPWLEGKIDNSTPMKKALQSEQTARLHHFLTQLERGMNPEEASKSVNKYLFDYGSKSKADKVMSDFVDPFWSFHKSNAKMLTSAPFNHPSKVNNILRANRELDNMVGEDDRATSEYREHQLPFGSFKDELNKDDYNYFYDENMLPDVDKALPLESDDLQGKMNPLIKIALQQSKGQGNFGNTIVDKDKAGYDEVTKDESKWEIARELNPILNTLFKSIDKGVKYQKKADEGVQSQSTSDKQIINQVLAYLLGNKGNYYRDTR